MKVKDVSAGQAVILKTDKESQIVVRSYFNDLNNRNLKPFYKIGTIKNNTAIFLEKPISNISLIDDIEVDLFQMQSPPI